MSENVVSTKAPCNRDDALFVLKTLRAAGHVAYFAGGCVRDLLLGKEPADYDVATDATPTIVKNIFRNAQLVGEAFGVILVRTGRSTVEVATFRTDGTYLDRRRPSEVRFTTPEEDAKRRDFTINGMFLDPVENRVLDFVGGQQDLKDGILRAIGNPDDRFEEDHLRLLRAVRFAARLNFQIEQKTEQAIVKRAGYLKSISPERVGDELKRMLTAPTRSIAWKLLSQLNLTPVLMRMLNLRVITGSSATLEFKKHSSIYAAIASDQHISLGLALAVFTLDYRLENAVAQTWSQLLDSKTIIDSVGACRKSFKISNDESEEMKGILSVLHLLGAELPTVAALKRFMAQPTSTQSTILLHAMKTVDPTLTRIDWLAQQFKSLDQVDCAPIPLLNGDDLTAAGYKPGPLFKRILDSVYDAQLEDRISDKSAALQMGMALASEKTGSEDTGGT